MPDFGSCRSSIPDFRFCGISIKQKLCGRETGSTGSFDAMPSQDPADPGTRIFDVPALALSGFWILYFLDPGFSILQILDPGLPDF